jgi:microsomal dipeptidase-like Zn-dependent dipeptidase
MPEWFEDNRDFGNIEKGLIEVGFSKTDAAKVMGNNWLRFFDENFGRDY